MDYKRIAVDKHKEWRGKIEIKSRAQVKDKEDLTYAYTPGVAEPCLLIEKEPDLSFKLTRRWNTAAVITDGSAVLGLGDIGGVAGMPVMEGKCVLFKEFGGVDAIPICLDTNDTGKIVETIVNIAGSFGGINLEDIAAPRCFDIEDALKRALKVPVFHDDQHGTAIVVLAGLRNAMKIAGKHAEDVKVVIAGAGAAGIAIAKLMMQDGFQNIILCNSKGILSKDREYQHTVWEQIAEQTNPNQEKGTLEDAIKGADVFIGVSAAGILTTDMVKTMAKDAIVFAMANPVPEIYPEDAMKAGAKVVATGRSDFPNQINNVLAFPGIFRGAFDAGATDINNAMKLAAVDALEKLVSPEELSPAYIIPDPFDQRVCREIAEKVRNAAIATGAVRPQ